MNPVEKQAMIQFMTEIAGHLEDDDVQLEHKRLQTQNDIDRLKARKGTLELLKAGIFFEEDGDEACETMDAIGVSLNHLCAVIAHQEHKLDVLGLALKTAKSAFGEASGFANSLPGIPTTD